MTFKGETERRLYIRNREGLFRRTLRMIEDAKGRGKKDFRIRCVDKRGKEEFFRIPVSRVEKIADSLEQDLMREGQVITVRRIKDAFEKGMK